MTRYVKYKHGLAIYSGNIYCVVDHVRGKEPPLNLPDGVEEFRDGYRAILAFENFDLDQIDTLNVNLRTPAHQMVWDVGSINFTYPYEDDGTIRDIPQIRITHTVNDYFERFLNTVIGPRYKMWDTYSRGSYGNEQQIFFKRRKDALDIVRRIEKSLKGIKV